MTKNKVISKISLVLVPANIFLQKSTALYETLRSKTWQFELWEKSQQCCPPSQNFGEDSPSLSPMIYATASIKLMFIRPQTLKILD